MNYVCVNGKFLDGTRPVLLSANRGYRYGHGIFETMKWSSGRIQLANLHFERFFDGLDQLKIPYSKQFTREKIKAEVENTCIKNNCTDLARVRLSASRGNGGLNDEADTALHYIIEAWPLSQSSDMLNEDGLEIGIYEDARKSIDKFSNLKSASFLPYTMAAVHARENNLNDCLVMNQAGRIADTTMANIFLIKNDEILTPALGEGCVAGTMRKYLIHQFKKNGMQIEETKITIQQLKEADEVFLTNAIQGIRWVKKLGDKQYASVRTRDIFHQFITHIP